MEIPESERLFLPKFFIGGGMKCGTTSLHWILSQHPEIFIPENESHFFTIDDIEQNPDFFLKNKYGWVDWDFEREFREYLRWYKTFFQLAQTRQLIGEDCVSYLSSNKAASRIARLLPDSKFIFMLRDPVARTYSQYWHWVKTNRATCNFETTLQFSPGHLIQRSFYYDHLVRYFKYFKKEQIKIVIFERFISETQKVVDEICAFLSLNQSIDMSQIDKHMNKALVPKNINLQLLVNAVLKTRISGRKYVSFHLPNCDEDNFPHLLSSVNKNFGKLNLTSKKEYPPMRKETCQFLQALFTRKNRNLSDLIDISLEVYWPYMKA